jgi:hypothetical protein
VQFVSFGDIGSGHRSLTNGNNVAADCDRDKDLSVRIGRIEDPSGSFERSVLIES